MPEYDVISEPELRKFAHRGAVRAVKAVKLDDAAGGHFGVLVEVGNAGEPLILFSQRKQPRAWASLNRLTEYLQTVTPNLGSFEVIFTERSVANASN